MVPGTPQHNGVSEMMNRTIMERARSIKLHAGLPLSFWAEAVSTAMYLINRGPSSALDGGIPEEAWYGKKVDYSFLRVFGCEENKEESKKEYAMVEDLLDGKVTHESVQEPTQQESQTPTMRRSFRVRKEPENFSPSLYYLLLTDSGESESFDEAMQVDASKKWEQAMDEEHKSLMENQT
ncbi:hypothetical protein KI387_002667 [Taxus chinensis]|uniref:Integrase catalytic domain-containing protein n=1 Tax=Taxus chinensis TaxID=29808 RepID=A0AA38LNU9_TAXCH|nr:hypothetical protein KI387_002667 [Taxus chinensis]